MEKLYHLNAIWVIDIESGETIPAKKEKMQWGKRREGWYPLQKGRIYLARLSIFNGYYYGVVVVRGECAEYILDWSIERGVPRSYKFPYAIVEEWLKEHDLSQEGWQEKEDALRFARFLQKKGLLVNSR